MTNITKGPLSLLSLLLIITNGDGLIVPEELASILSVAYSNIPPIKKGTDSRVGFGFSLGNHADFQVLFELGPQKDTNPIGTPYATNTKRQVNQKPKKEIDQRKKPVDGNSYLNNWSQDMKQQQKKPNNVKPFQPLPIPDDGKDSQNPGAVNIQDTLDAMKLAGDSTNMELKQPVPPQMPAQVLMRLKELYGEKPRFVPKRKTEATTTESLKTAASNLERLTQFRVNESEMQKKEVDKRKITAQLSDVSLDDE